MWHTCRLNGRVKIDEAIILELIDTPEIQRLKGVDQAGYFEPFFPNTKQTRYEHSVGCYLLLKKFNAPLEEQIAGLLHDASHAVFSHCADYALAGGSEKDHNYQDNIYEKFILNSNIPNILEKHGFNVGYIINEDNFPLQETTLPDLCADRIDYSLRSLVTYKKIKQAAALDLLNDLLVLNNSWVFNSLKKAQKFADFFLYLNNKYYAGIESAVMFRTVGDYLKHALKKGYIDEKDLHTTDKLVINKINQSLKSDPDLVKLFRRMNNKTKFENNEKDFEAEVYCKSRVVDPLVLDDDSKPKRLSDLNLEWKKKVKTESKPKKYYLKFFD